MECPACDSPLTGRPAGCARCGFPLSALREALRQLYLLGAGLASTPFIYAGMILGLHVRPVAPAQTGHLQMVEYLFAGMSVVLAALLIFWPDAPESLTPEAARRRLVLQCALAEPPALLGLILHFLGAPPGDCLALVAGSLALYGVIGSRLPRLTGAIRRGFVDTAKEQTGGAG